MAIGFAARTAAMEIATRFFHQVSVKNAGPTWSRRHAEDVRKVHRLFLSLMPHTLEFSI
ncbi:MULTISPECIES: hypothetical protein [unclassified Burkholderia]|uniref:hypothetical protein n=1 Tax=unclassified Burkholderia TaxID=2613784 RepID=UPI0015C628B4|nr:MULTISPECIES: hypothetical protein [unclassified Burkholderia]